MERVAVVHILYDQLKNLFGVKLSERAVLLIICDSIESDGRYIQYTGMM